MAVAARQHRAGVGAVTASDLCCRPMERIRVHDAAQAGREVVGGRREEPRAQADGRDDPRAGHLDVARRPEDPRRPLHAAAAAAVGCRDRGQGVDADRRHPDDRRARRRCRTRPTTRSCAGCGRRSPSSVRSSGGSGGPGWPCRAATTSGRGASTCTSRAGGVGRERRRRARIRGGRGTGWSAGRRGAPRLPVGRRHREHRDGRGAGRRRDRRRERGARARDRRHL